MLQLLTLLLGGSVLASNTLKLIVCQVVDEVRREKLHRCFWPINEIVIRCLPTHHINETLSRHLIVCFENIVQIFDDMLQITQIGSYIKICNSDGIRVVVKTKDFGLGQLF